MKDSQRKAMFAKKGKLNLSDINTTQLSTPKIFDMLTIHAKENILSDTGIPQPNFEPYTHDDVIKTALLGYHSLDKKLQVMVSKRIGEISYNNMRNHAWVH